MDESTRYTGLILASASMLIPKGQTTSLMDTETIDLYSITGTHGTRLPGTHTYTHTQMYRYFHTIHKNKHLDLFYIHYLFMHPAPHICPETEENAVRCQFMYSLELYTACEGSVKLSSTSWSLAGFI